MGEAAMKGILAEWAQLSAGTRVEACRRILVKPNFFVLLLSFCLVSTVYASAMNLPGACGSDSVKFNVKTQQNQPAPSPPADGKAQIVFIENENQPIGPFMHATVRFGMDGAWVGADNGNSYFVLSADPGVHHLCANWQSTLGRFKKNVELTSFTAEPGKIYFFSAAVPVESEDVVTFGLTQLNDDEGKYQMTLSKLSTSKLKK